MPAIRHLAITLSLLFLGNSLAVPDWQINSPELIAYPRLPGTPAVVEGEAYVWQPLWPITVVSTSPSSDEVIDIPRTLFDLLTDTLAFEPHPKMDKAELSCRESFQWLTALTDVDGQTARSRHTNPSTGAGVAVGLTGDAG